MSVVIITFEFSQLFIFIRISSKGSGRLSNVINPIKNNSIRFKTKSDFKVYDSNRKLIESVLPEFRSVFNSSFLADCI